MSLCLCSECETERFKLMALFFRFSAAEEPEKEALRQSFRVAFIKYNFPVFGTA